MENEALYKAAMESANAHGVSVSDAWVSAMWIELRNAANKQFAPAIKAADNRLQRLKVRSAALLRRHGCVVRYPGWGNQHSSEPEIYTDYESEYEEQ